MEEINNISEKTVVFVLLRYDSFEQQQLKNTNKETWEIHGGYDVKESPIPAPNTVSYTHLTLPTNREV